MQPYGKKKKKKLGIALSSSHSCKRKQKIREEVLKK